MIETVKSLLFVPGDNYKLIGKAAQSAADAIIVDLEDSVAPDAKSNAREGLQQAVTNLRGGGKYCVVRVNSEIDDCENDISAAIQSKCDAIMLPKVESTTSLERAAAALADCQSKSHEKAPVLIALIESAAGCIAANEIAAADLVAALALGSEDFASCMGAPPSEALLNLPVRQLAIAARGHNKPAFAMPMSIADFRNFETIKIAAKAAAAVGCSGALCIHPKQVEAVNDAFAPCAAEIAKARDILECWKQAQEDGKAVARLGDSMIDRPVVLRAQFVLQRAGYL